MRFCYLLIFTIFLEIHAQRHPVTDYNDHFNCIETFQDDGTGNWVGSGSWGCCGYNALGERHCAPEAEWEKYEGKYRRCVKLGTNGFKEPEDLIGSGMDLCCNNSGGYSKYLNDCGACKSFYVWDFLSHEDMSTNTGVTLSEDWRTTYLAQDRDANDGYDNKVFPGGFVKGTLREFNDPNVCIYIPNAGGKVIEIKVESEGTGDRLCIGDLHDEATDRNNPGQNDACSDTTATTCFGDANVETTETNKPIGFPFYVFCDEGCEEGGGSGDVSLWLRARFSPETWLQGTYQADKNVEMWCEYVVRDYPEFDVYPSDLSVKTAPLVFEEPNSTTQLFTALTLLLFFIWY